MPTSIAEVERALEARSINEAMLLQLRRQLRVPFRRHPLGFVVCTLLEEGDRRLRIHYWPIAGNVQQSPECQIHDHIFEFESWVLAGTIENIEYAAAEHGSEFAVYRTDYERDHSLLSKTNDTLRLSVVNRSVYSTGASYTVPLGTLHETVRLGTTPALTVLVTRDIASSAPIVLGPITGQDRYTYEREILPEEAVEELFSSAP